MIRLSFFFALLFYGTIVFSQVMTTTAYRDISIPYIEQNLSKYNFAYPICADVLTDTNYVSPNNGLYLKATYGHRYLSNTPNKTDNHGGFDYWSTIDCDSVSYNNTNRIAILCMCDGTISQVLNGPDSVMELTSTGRSIQVTCDSLPQAMGGNIRINYRHLSSLGMQGTIADTASLNTIRINKGDTIGIMGASGYTSQVHLHLSTQGTHPLYGNAFVHTARLFDPNLYPNVLTTLTTAKIELLHSWSDSALFRIIWPYNQTINRFEFSNTNFNAVFDKEAAYDTGAANRDEHDCVAGFKVFAYQFNGKQTAKTRYDNEKLNIPAVYPASPQRDTNLGIYQYAHIPIIEDSIAFVYDFMVENLPMNYDKDSFVVKLSDVWGHTVEGRFGSVTTPIVHLSTSSQTILFPNPTKRMITLDFGDAKKRVVRIYSLAGKMIQEYICKNEQQTISLQKLTAGIYMIKIKSTNRVEMLKVIKH